MTKTIMILALAALFVAGTITTTTFVSAAPPEDNPGKPFDVILEKLDAIIAAIGAIDISGIGLNPTTQTQIDNIETEVTNIEGKLDGTVSSLLTDPTFGLDITVDPNTFFSTGHNANIQSSSNHNPVALHVLVTQDGTPVQSLSFSDFSWQSSFVVQPGGVATELCSVTECGTFAFRETPSGTYLLMIHPATVEPLHSSANWSASGMYWGTLTVNAGSQSESKLVTFNIQ